VRWSCGLVLVIGNGWRFIAGVSRAFMVSFTSWKISRWDGVARGLARLFGSVFAGRSEWRAQLLL
jgi:hypothetical protein